LRGSQAEDIKGLVDYFTKYYTDELAAGRIPWRLLDGKAALRTLRRLVQEETGVSFSDRDVLDSYEKKEVPKEIIEIVDAVRAMFGNRTTHSPPTVAVPNNLSVPAQVKANSPVTKASRAKPPAPRRSQEEGKGTYYWHDC